MCSRALTEPAPLEKVRQTSWTAITGGICALNSAALSPDELIREHFFGGDLSGNVKELVGNTRSLLENIRFHVTQAQLYRLRRKHYLIKGVFKLQRGKRRVELGFVF